MLTLSRRRLCLLDTTSSLKVWSNSACMCLATHCCLRLNLLRATCIRLLTCAAASVCTDTTGKSSHEVSLPRLLTHAHFRVPSSTWEWGRAFLTLPHSQTGDWPSACYTIC
jgi:hypothetical protein